MALPLPDAHGEVRAVLALGMDLGWIARALANVPVAPGTNIVLVDGRGTVLAPERWRGRSVSEHPVFQRIVRITAPTSFEAVGIDGIERIFVARPLNIDLGGHSYLWVASPKSSVSHAALQDFFKSGILIFATVLALILAVIWQGNRVVLRPVRDVREAARRFGASQLSARTQLSHGDDEIGQLATTFDEMAEAIETRERELDRSRASLLRANRTLRVITAVKDVIVRAENEQGLFGELCHTMVGVGGYPMAFVARAAQDVDSITVLASKGLPDEYRDRLPASWAARDSGYACTAAALRENRAVIIRNLQRDPCFAPWREQGQGMDYEAIIGLPLHVAGAVWGMLAIASTQDGAFDEEETRLLEELAGDVGRGIETLRLRTDKHAAESALLRMNTELEQRVAERTVELQQANDELKTFSYSISHDLRAPLRAIDGFCQVLDEECGTRLTDECRDYLARTHDAAQRMGELIDDMIELARISHREMAVSDVDLSALATAIGAELAAAEPLRPVHLSVAPGLTVRGDPLLLRLLLQNLLDNAWKYTRRTPQAEIGFGREPLPSGEDVYYVRDNGVGFDMAFADRLFRPFSRLHRADEYPGSGIGLATVARIVTRHHGRVWAEAAPGRGATFRFVLG